MSRLNPQKLHVNYLLGVELETPIVPRRYTLTHSDMTGDLYLTIGPDYDLRQISGWYTRFMRDEVLAEWKDSQDGPSLHVYCHVSGGLIFGRAGWRDAIFRSEMRLVLEAIRYGDRTLFAANPRLDHAPVLVHLQASQPRYNKTEAWGILADWRVLMTHVE
ncbi:MAG: staygreen family protein [Candidatus Bathyarchaeota archaeon]|nr:staygreen family protein [Candidatus Bathyarchaeota archaeon]MDH5419542.1 staygreen family protein [Candidatus Bathyarchaeota archaeon]MDH5623254.1 staygreen family protein [Candidatus Bathyarchaeota archaeon]MDH5635658.1 staygreen family protein [Candidatus Bathyarchaeota archaeon]MDH5701589.1 staygreen family protein [Candidatus Bathyarchaeota archaeon]